MNEQQVSALIMIYGFAAILSIVVAWLGEREDAKHRERERRENLYKAWKGVFGKEAADRLMERDRREKVKQ